MLADAVDLALLRRSSLRAPGEPLYAVVPLILQNGANAKKNNFQKSVKLHIALVGQKKKKV